MNPFDDTEASPFLSEEQVSCANIADWKEPLIPVQDPPSVQDPPTTLAPAATPAVATEDYSKKKLDALRALCKERKVRGYSTASKRRLIQLLTDNDAAGTATAPQESDAAAYYELNTDYMNQTGNELVAQCKQRNIKRYAGKKKSEMIALLQQKDHEEAAAKEAAEVAAKAAAAAARKRFLIIECDIDNVSSITERVQRATIFDNISIHSYNADPRC